MDKSGKTLELRDNNENPVLYQLKNHYKFGRDFKMASIKKSDLDKSGKNEFLIMESDLRLLILNGYIENCVISGNGVADVNIELQKQIKNYIRPTKVDVNNTGTVKFLAKEFGVIRVIDAENIKPIKGVRYEVKQVYFGLNGKVAVLKLVNNTGEKIISLNDMKKMGSQKNSMGNFSVVSTGKNKSQVLTYINITDELRNKLNEKGVTDDYLKGRGILNRQEHRYEDTIAIDDLDIITARAIYGDNNVGFIIPRPERFSKASYTNITSKLSDDVNCGDMYNEDDYFITMYKGCYKDEFIESLVSMYDKLHDGKYIKDWEKVNSAKELGNEVIKAIQRVEQGDDYDFRRSARKAMGIKLSTYFMNLVLINNEGNIDDIALNKHLDVVKHLKEMYDNNTQLSDRVEYYFRNDPYYTLDEAKMLEDKVIDKDTDMNSLLLAASIDKRLLNELMQYKKHPNYSDAFMLEEYSKWFNTSSKEDDKAVSEKVEKQVVADNSADVETSIKQEKEETSTGEQVAEIIEEKAPEETENASETNIEADGAKTLTSIKFVDEPDKTRTINVKSDGENIYVEVETVRRTVDKLENISFNEFVANGIATDALMCKIKRAVIADNAVLSVEAIKDKLNSL